MAKDYTDVPDLETARRLLIAYDETTRGCADEIERLREENKELKFESDFLEEQNIRRNRTAIELYEENKRLREEYQKYIDQLEAEIERLREALRTIADNEIAEYPDVDMIRNFARSALQQKESK